MTRETAKAFEQQHELTPDELDAVSGGFQTGGSSDDKASPKFEASVGGGSGAGKVALLFPF